MVHNKGFFKRLFDFSFSEFITTDLIKLLYGLAMVMAGVWILGFITAGFGTHPAVGLLFLIVSPLLFVLFVIFARVCLELIIVTFQIAENTKDSAEALRQ